MTFFWLRLLVAALLGSGWHTATIHPPSTSAALDADGPALAEDFDFKAAAAKCGKAQWELLGQGLEQPPEGTGPKVRQVVARTRMSVADRIDFYSNLERHLNGMIARRGGKCCGTSVGTQEAVGEEEAEDGAPQSAGTHFAWIDYEVGKRKGSVHLCVVAEGESVTLTLSFFEER